MAFYSSLAQGNLDALSAATTFIVKKVPRTPTCHLLCEASNILYRTLWRKSLDPMTSVATSILGESQERAKLVAKGCALSNIRFWSDYSMLAYADDTYAQKRIEEISCKDMSVLELVNRSRRPLILLSVHLGNYLSGFIKVLSELDLHDRELLTFRLLEETELERLAYRHFKSRVGTFSVARLGNEGGLLKAVRLLKAGGIVGTFADLHRGFGPTAEVSLFGVPCDLIVGPAYMAVLTKAIVLPIALCPDDNGREQLTFKTPIDATIRPGENKDIAIQRVMNEIARNTESFVRHNPGSWLMWPNLGAYLSKSIQVDA